MNRPTWTFEPSDCYREDLGCITVPPIDPREIEMIVLADANDTACFGRFKKAVEAAVYPIRLVRPDGSIQLVTDYRDPVLWQRARRRRKHRI